MLLHSNRVSSGLNQSNWPCAHLSPNFVCGNAVNSCLLTPDGKNEIMNLFHRSGGGARCFCRGEVVASKQDSHKRDGKCLCVQRNRTSATKFSFTDLIAHIHIFTRAPSLYRVAQYLLWADVEFGCCSKGGRKPSLFLSLHTFLREG